MIGLEGQLRLLLLSTCGSGDGTWGTWLAIHVVATEVVGWQSIWKILPHWPLNIRKKQKQKENSFRLCQSAAMASTDEPLVDPGTLLKNLSSEGQHLVIKYGGEFLFRIFQIQHWHTVGLLGCVWFVGSIFQSHLPSSNTISGNFANPWRSSCQKTWRKIKSWFLVGTLGSVEILGFEKPLTMHNFSGFLVRVR